MASKRKPKKNGGRRPNAGRKSSETHFAAINDRFDQLERLLESLMEALLLGTDTTVRDAATAAATGEDLAVVALRRFSAARSAVREQHNGSPLPGTPVQAEPPPDL